MEEPTPSDSLPKYLADGIPKQDTETLRDLHAYMETLIEYREQPVGEDELPETAEPVDDTDTSGNSCCKYDFFIQCTA